MQKLRIKKLAILFIMLAAMSFLAACTSLPEKSVNKPSKLTIVTSIFPYYDFARQIAKENADIINIVPPGVEPHQYEPGTGDIKKIYGADIFIYNGLGMDPWAERLRPDLEKNGIKVIDIGEGIPSLNLITQAGNSNAPDPHIWMDFGNAGSALKLIYEQTALADPANSKAYKTNYLAYNADLQKLSAAFKSELANCTAREFMSSHLAFEYLAKAANLTNISIAGISTEQEPSPKRLAELITIIKEKKLKYIYIDSLESTKFADVLVAETNAQIQPLFTLENVTKDQLNDPTITYVSLMKSNLENLKQGLACLAN